MASGGVESSDSMSQERCAYKSTSSPLSLAKSAGQHLLGTCLSDQKREREDCEPADRYPAIEIQLVTTIQAIRQLEQ